MKYYENKITVINGCETYDSLEKTVIDSVHSKLADLKNEYAWFELSEKKLDFCKACDVCQVKTPGVCAAHDSLNDTLKQYINSSLVIVITPVRFGCCNLLTKNFIDRTEPLFLSYQVLRNGKIMMKKRYERYPDVLCVGISEQHNANCRREFTDFISNCNLILASENFEIQFISDSSDMDKLSTCFSAHREEATQ